MADYTQITDFSAKDALSAGDPNKLIVGADFDAEFDAISTAIATKLESTGAQVFDGADELRDVGFNDLEIKTEDTSDTLDATHAGGVYFKDGTSEITLTLEASTSNAFEAGNVCTIINAGASANIVVSEGTGTTLYVLPGFGGRVDADGSATVAPGSIATLWRKSSTEYYLFGNGVTA